MAETWTLTLRVKGRVVRERFGSLKDAVKAAAAHADEVAAGPRAAPIDLRVRSYAPEAQVTARVEVSGPSRFMPAARGGLDVLGDGTVQAWTGRVRRAVVEPRGKETQARALRRALAQSTSVEP